MLQILGASRDHGSSEDPVELLLGCHARIRTFTALAARLSSAEPAPEADVAEAARRVRRYHAVALPLHEMDEELSIAPRLQRGAPAELGEALAAMKGSTWNWTPCWPGCSRSGACLRMSLAEEAI